MAKIAFLDIEASGLGPGSYPIEIAFAVADDETLEIGSTGSWLIHPTEDWSEFGWDPAAEDLHGLSRDVLERDGHSAWFVADSLNKELGDVVAVFTDAPLSDSNWLSVLYEEFPGSCSFGLRDFNVLINGEFSGTERQRILELLSAARDWAKGEHPVFHRALPDALRLRDTWRHMALAIRRGGEPTHVRPS